mgnify:CR=1 FL=1
MWFHSAEQSAILRSHTTKVGNPPQLWAQQAPPLPSDLDGGVGKTTYGPIPNGDGVRFLWVFTDERGIGAQSITPVFRSDRPEIHADETIETLVKRVARGYLAVGGNPGEDADPLATLSILLLLYLAAIEPDLEAVPPERMIRPQHLQGAEVSNLGWRVGSAIRRWQNDHEEGGSPDSPEGGRASGWRLPPHIRAAHFQRVRIATRDKNGQIVGDVHGVPETDWHYELRWIPPTPVNVDDNGPQRTIRRVVNG